MSNEDGGDGPDSPGAGTLSPEAAATRIQALHRGKSTRRSVNRGETGGGERLTGKALAEAYQAAAAAEGRTANPLALSALRTSGSEKFGIKAPGCDERTFNCRMRDEDLAVLCEVLQDSAPFLEEVDLTQNLLGDAGARSLATLLGRAPGLSSLTLRGNSIGAEGCEALCRAVTSCPTLRRLDLSQNPVGRGGGLAVVELLRANTSLQELFLADAELDINVLVALAAAMFDGAAKLKLCDIENPRLSNLQEEHTVHLGRMLRVNTHLSELRLGKHRMRDEGVRQLVSFLIENKTLRVLDLRCNELGADGARHLGTLLSDDCQLTVLNLSGNRIGEKCNVEGARAIADALGKNRMLRHLDLNGNELCGDALQVLGEAMEHNSTLETVALFNNQWDQPSSFKFHQILSDRARILPLRADFVTSQVDLRIDICKLDGPLR